VGGGGGSGGPGATGVTGASWGPPVGTGANCGGGGFGVLRRGRRVRGNNGKRLYCKGG
jgi:hypothetical protein